jgi:hypothetical protein
MANEPATSTSTTSPWIEIFRAGDYRSAGKGLITRADLERVVRNYDPSFHEAPVAAAQVQLGHKDDAPAYAWIDRLAVDGDTLLAKEKQVDPNFNEARKAGRYKKRSVAFYKDASGQIAGLRHVAYLGAQPPEVKGLKDVAFDDHGQEFIVLNFGEEESVPQENKTVAEQIREYLSGLLGVSAQPATFSEGDAKRIATEAITAASAPLTAQIAALEAQLQAQAVKFAEQEQLLAGGAVKQRAAQAVTRLKAAGKWIPAFEKQGLPVLFDELAKIEETVEFGEGEAKKTVTPLETLVLFLEGLPKIVPTGKLVEPGAAKPVGKSTGDPLTDAAKALQVAEKITFSEALDRVIVENPELARAGSVTGGTV